MKITVLVCTSNNKFTSRVASTCQSCALDVIYVKNGKELPGVIESTPPGFLLLDASLENPCVIDTLDMLSQLKYDLPIIVIGACEEKVFLSLKRIAQLKNLSLFTIHLNQLGKEELLKVMGVIHTKSALVNDEALVNALEKKQFTMFYQPKIEANTYKLLGVESLIRWERPHHGLIAPDSFIPIAEDSGLIIPMTYWIIGEVFRQYAAWKKQKIFLKIAINLSSKILTDSNLPLELSRLTTKFKVNPKDICFEITETTAMHSPEKVLEVLTRIRLKGFELSIDDFGTGYSSLVELQRLPFTELKIDKSFISDIGYNKDNMHIVRSIVYLGKNMNLSLVAEGVESDEALVQLKELGCDIIQGYIISKPLSSEAFLQWHAEHIDKNGVFVN